MRLHVAEGRETARRAGRGVGPPTWLVQVTAGYSHNWYRVRLVEMRAVGSTPAAAGPDNLLAVNIGESFTAAGGLAAGTYAVMWRVGDSNVIQVAV